MYKILLVEDEDTLRDAYGMILATQPYQLDIANDGKMALDLCRKNLYDLILLDLMMPVMDGVEFLKRFKPHASKTTRVVVLSNLSSGVELHEAMQLGAVGSALKSSMSPKQLISMIRRELKAT